MSYDTINLQVNKIKLCLLFVTRINYCRSYDMGGNFVLLYVAYQIVMYMHIKPAPSMR